MPPADPALVPVARLRSGDDYFRCVPLALTLRARACVLARADNPYCARCALGAQVHARVGDAPPRTHRPHTGRGTLVGRVLGGARVTARVSGGDGGHGRHATWRWRRECCGAEGEGSAAELRAGAARCGCDERRDEA